MRKRSSRSPLQPPPSDDKMPEFLAAGSMVEASSNEEGFKGVWYVAKIIRPRKNRFLIEYQSLTSDEDPEKPLRENVHISFIRPVPPPPAADQSYELHDVVDAYDRDGWWKGTVSKVEVLEGKEGSCAKYTVSFENPGDEELTLCSDKLRFHLVWAHGEWTKPFKQEIPVIMPKNTRGQSSDAGIGKHKSCPRRMTRSRIKSCIKKSRTNLILLDVEKEEADNGFGQKDKVAEQHTNSNEKVTSTSIDQKSSSKRTTRPRYKKSAKKSRTSLLDAEEEEDNECIQKDKVTEHSNSNDKPTSSSSKRTIGEMSPSKDEESSVKKPRNNPLDIEEENDIGLAKNNKGEKQSVSEGNATEMVSEDKKTEISSCADNADVTARTPPILPVEDHIENVGESCNSVVDNQVPSTHFESILSVKKSGNSLLDIEEENDNGFGKNEKGEQQNVSEEENDNGFGKNEKGEQQNDSEGKASKETEISLGTENAARTPPIVPVEDRIENVAESCNSAVDDQVQPTHHEGDQEQVENINQPPAIIAQSEEGQVENLDQAVIEPVEDRVMPFTKNSPIWELVYSLDVFRSMPQNPHFSPLFEVNPALREGYAIGHFLSFSSLVEKTSKIRANEPTQDFESSLEALADLELHGFNVKPVADRLKILLSNKTRQQELENEINEIQIKIAKCDAERKEVEEEIKEIEEKIRVVEAEREVKISEKLIQESEIENLGMAANGFNEQMSNADLDFENLAAAPWC